MSSSFRDRWNGLRGLLHATLLLFIGLAAAAWSPAPLAGQSYNFRHYTDRGGLPQRQVLALHQGREGYVWFGTYGGMSRYNGSVIRTFTTADGLSSNVVNAFAEDDRGRLFMGTLGGGLCIMVRAEFECFSEVDGLPSPDVRNLRFGGDETLWIATDAGLARLRGREFTTYTTADGLPSSVTLSLEMDDEGQLWVGTQAGLARFEGGSFREAQPEVLSGEAIQMLLSLPGGLLIGTGSELHLLSGDRMRRLSPVGLPASAVFLEATLDSSGIVWIATSAGLLRLEGEDFLLLTEANGLLQNELRRVMTDVEGNIWVGSDVGAGKLVPGPFRGYSVREGLPSPFGRAIAEDADGRLWVGTRDGAAAWSREEGRFVVTLPGDALADRRVYALARAPEGGMLVGTRDGLAHWVDGSFRLFGTADGLPASYVLSLIPDGSGGIWIGTESGVARWRNGVVTSFPRDHALSDLFVVSMAVDPEDRLWLGLAAGGARIWDGERLEMLDGERGLTDQVVWSIHPDEQGRMWIGSNGDGVFRVDGSEILRFTMRNGLSNDFVWQVLVDSRGSVWLFTNQGLNRYREGSFDLFTRSDGLIDMEGTAAAALEHSGGELWFGTSQGVLAYDPGAQVFNRTPPPTRIEGVTLGRSLLDFGTELHFRSDLLQIRFAALTFRDEGGVRFRYRLVMGDRDSEPWSDPVSDRAVSFASLGPGSYTFEVVAINADGIASETPASLAFTVVPEFWQTWWFRLLGVALLVGAASSVPVVRARRLEQERRRLEALVEERTGELEESNVRLRAEIGERERFEEALRASEARLREIIENSTNVFYAHTPDHRITYISPQARDVLGLDPESAAQRWSELATDDPNNEAGVKITERALETGERQPPHELELRHGKGHPIRVQVTEAPVLRDGEVVGIVGSLTDVTDSRRAEEERVRLEEQLHQVQKMEAVGRLAGGIAHEFNNLLASIMGHTSLITMDLEEDHPVHADLREVVRASERAAELVAQLLTFGRKQVAQPTPRSLNRVVENNALMLRRLIGDDIRIVTDLSSDEPWVAMDGGQLDQMIFNLVMNARDAMPGGGTLTIGTALKKLETRPRDWEDPGFTPGPYAVLQVSDEGSGMSPETVERIFEPFFTTKEVGEGSGLGLSTVYGIVKQNRGHIRLETRVGRGTTFQIYLPVTREAVPT